MIYLQSQVSSFMRSYDQLSSTYAIDQARATYAERTMCGATEAMPGVWP